MLFMIYDMVIAHRNAAEVGSPSGIGFAVR